MNLKGLKSYKYDHKGIKVEIDNSRKFEKLINMWKLRNTLINNQQIKKEI
jgi:hypothetical protein